MPVDVTPGPSTSGGSVLHAADVLGWVGDEDITENTSRLRLATATTSIPNATLTGVTFVVESDPLGLIGSISGADITFAKLCWVLVQVNFQFDTGNAVGDRYAYLYTLDANGGETTNTPCHLPAAVHNDAGIAGLAVPPVTTKMQPGGTMGLYVWQNSGGALNIVRQTFLYMSIRPLLVAGVPA